MQQELSQPYFYSFNRNDIGKIVLFRSEKDLALYPYMIILNAHQKDEWDDELLFKDLFAEQYGKVETYTIGQLVGEQWLDYIQIKTIPDDIPANRMYERRGDMGQERLQIILQEDGDVCLTLHNAARDHTEFQRVGIEFCTGSGGGRSPHTLRALQELVRAVARDEKGLPL